MFVGRGLDPSLLPCGSTQLTGNPARKASPLGGKLSPQVTDEGVLAGHIPLIRLAWDHPALHRDFIAVSPPASSSYKCARTARTPYLLFLIYYLLFAPPGHSRPRWCTLHCFSITHITKKQPYFSVRLYLGALCSGLSRALKTPHRGVFAPRYAKRPTRPVLVPDGAPRTAFQ